MIGVITLGIMYTVLTFAYQGAVKPAALQANGDNALAYIVKSVATREKNNSMTSAVPSRRSCEPRTGSAMPSTMRAARCGRTGSRSCRETTPSFVMTSGAAAYPTGRRPLRPSAIPGDPKAHRK